MVISRYSSGRKPPPGPYSTAVGGRSVYDLERQEQEYADNGAVDADVTDSTVRAPAAPVSQDMDLVQDSTVKPAAMGYADGINASDLEEDDVTGDLAALQASNEAERAAQQAKMQADKQRALGDASARMGLAGGGLSGATGALLADIGTKATQEEVLTLADLDRGYRIEERGVADRDRYQGFEDEDRGMSAEDRARRQALEDEDRATSAADRERGQGREDSDDTWEQRQRDIANWNLEDEDGVDYDGDGFYGHPSNERTTSGPDPEREDDQGSAVAATGTFNGPTVSVDDTEADEYGLPRDSTVVGAHAEGSGPSGSYYLIYEDAQGERRSVRVTPEQFAAWYQAHPDTPASDESDREDEDNAFGSSATMEGIDILNPGWIFRQGQKLLGGG